MNYHALYRPLVLRFFAFVVPLIFLHISSIRAITLPSSYDTVWTTQSNDSAGSMPVGGGDIGMNVWAEDGEILLYLAKSGAFDENNSLLKLGRVRLSLSPNPFDKSANLFEQRLLINDGYIKFTGTNNTSIKVWADIFHPVVHIELASDVVLDLTASFETWRAVGHQMESGEQQQTSWGVNQSPKIPLPFQYPDTILFEQNGVLSYHQNLQQPLFDFQMSNQGLSGVASELYNPMLNNTFGLYMTSPQLVPGSKTTGKYIDTNFTAFSLVSTEPASSYNLYISTAQNQTTDTEAWKSDLVAAAAVAPAQTQDTSKAWWRSFWDRSYIIINPDADPSDAGFQVGKNYQYFRYMMGCNSVGDWPTRFNGGLFTFDPSLVPGPKFTPDFRKWSGGTFTVQNQRLLIWPLLKSGDLDLAKSSFEFYRRITPNNRILAQTYFGVDATLFSEQIDNTGLPNVYEYDAQYFDGGPPRGDPLFPPGIAYNFPLSWQQDTANEFADIILQANIYSGLDVTPYLPFIELQLAWFDVFYTKRNGLTNDGKLIIYPGSGAETYKFALDPSSTTSGLRQVITDLLKVNPEYTKGNTSYYEAYLKRIPETPLRECPADTTLTCVSPASNWSYTVNTEPTALYTVFPWGEYGLGASTNISHAMNAYLYDISSVPWHDTIGWRQDQIWLARLGLTSAATNITTSRLSDSTTYRFSAFKGPYYDWSPDFNHYGSGAIGLQEQLMQNFVGDQIRLLPAWPEEWKGYFKLLAPKKTVVSGNLTGREVVGLVVEPEVRLKDVVFGAG